MHIQSAILYAMLTGAIGYCLWYLIAGPVPAHDVAYGWAVITMLFCLFLMVALHAVSSDLSPPPPGPDIDPEPEPVDAYIEECVTDLIDELDAGRISDDAINAILDTGRHPYTHRRYVYAIHSGLAPDATIPWYWSFRLRFTRSLEARMASRNRWYLHRRYGVQAAHLPVASAGVDTLAPGGVS